MLANSRPKTTENFHARSSSLLKPSMNLDPASSNKMMRNKVVQKIFQESQDLVGREAKPNYSHCIQRRIRANNPQNNILQTNGYSMRVSSSSNISSRPNSAYRGM